MWNYYCKLTLLAETVTSCFKLIETDSIAQVAILCFLIFRVCSNN